MASVGEILRRERERQGLTLANIAEQTRIKLSYLESLERDDYSSLPGKFFARSFTTQYAEKLGLNTPELQAALQRQVAPPEIFSNGLAQNQGPSLNPSSWTDKQFTVDPLPEGTASAITASKLTSSIVMLLAVIVACGTIFWLWQRSQLSSTSASAPSTSEVQTVQTKAEPPPLPLTVSPPAAQPTSPEVRQDAPVNPPVPAQQPATAPMQQASASPNPTIVQSPTSGRINLAVIAKEDTWIRITVDGKVIVQRVLTRGDSAVGTAQENAKILLGNAGGVDVRFNGNDIGSVGPRGQVRTVDFTPEKFIVVEPQKKPVEPTSPSPVAAVN